MKDNQLNHACLSFVSHNNQNTILPKSSKMKYSQTEKKHLSFAMLKASHFDSQYWAAMKSAIIGFSCRLPLQ